MRRPVSELLLWAHSELQELFRGFWTNCYFREFRPFTVLVYPQHGIGSDISQDKAPGHPLALFE